jgi:fucose permease
MSNKPSSRGVVTLVLLAFLGFVGLGLTDGVLGVAWPSISEFFGVPIESLGAILITFTAGYLITSFMSGYLLSRLSPGVLLMACCIAMTASLLGYALSAYWWLLVGFVGIGGLGAGAIDAGLNTIAATNYSARIVNWLHASYSLGATLGPIAMTSVLVAGWHWQWVYAVLAIGQTMLAAGFTLTHNRWSLSSSSNEASQLQDSATITETLRLPSVWLSVALFGLYTGVEVTAGQWAFTLLTEGRDVATGTAGTWVTVYWAALTAGRIGIGFFAAVIPATRLLTICLAGISVGALLYWFNPHPWLGFIGLTLTGFALGPVFPSLIATTSHRVGAIHVLNAVGYQITAASLGAALLPSGAGFLTRTFGLEVIAASVFFGSLTLFLLYEATPGAPRGRVGRVPLRESECDNSLQK